MVAAVALLLTAKAVPLTDIGTLPRFEAGGSIVIVDGPELAIPGVAETVHWSRSERFLAAKVSRPRPFTRRLLDEGQDALPARHVVSVWDMETGSVAQLPCSESLHQIAWVGKADELWEASIVGDGATYLEVARLSPRRGRLIRSVMTSLRVEVPPSMDGRPTFVFVPSRTDELALVALPAWNDTYEDRLLLFGSGGRLLAESRAREVLYSDQVASRPDGFLLGKHGNLEALLSHDGRRVRYAAGGSGPVQEKRKPYVLEHGTRLRLVGDHGSALDLGTPGTAAEFSPTGNRITRADELGISVWTLHMLNPAQARAFHRSQAMVAGYALMQSLLDRWEEAGWTPLSLSGTASPAVPSHGIEAGAYPFVQMAPSWPSDLGLRIPLGYLVAKEGYVLIEPGRCRWTTVVPTNL